ncbi:TPA: restriction endonuclease subunit S [Escherichia coli]|uniref:restriction endonuclease subunit S n=1 Tax=Escherichia coli TaxID=562 RepID=UPI0005CFD5F4|nr:restriction endonuclease subunit S [Escherichia coli]EFL5777553.1 restriction endonuclease subunit S [Escherichia coli]QMD90193.1 restriction endonuclease subunit S [Escherichia coli]QMH82407.1 restriction endonuclease subunit S [Escherichia coli]STG44154.1 type I restriction-modification enzyme S subunit [Escherichia coli]HAH9713535.1 restriction endonuclease subunit S [Escherichia coli]
MSVEKLIVDHMETWTSALQTRSTAGRGSSGKIDLYGIKKLRELILELAVRGKLVPQDPNDEPASELLKRIAAEKAELVKQGKIKKQKPLPEISEEEKPFELPEGWEWVRFETVLDFSGGSQPPKSYFIEESKEGYVQLIQIRDLGDSPQPIYIPADKASKFCTSKDILIGRYGASVGKVFWGKDGAYNVALIKIDNSLNLYVTSFLFWLLKSPLGQSLFSGVSRSAQDGFNKSDIAAKLLPVLSHKEQNRIIIKINELMSLCDQLEQQSLTSLDAHQQVVETLLGTLTDSQNAEELAENWARISEHFDTLFTTEASVDALKQTILQLAVMGKLVPQDPNDEPASELLKRIAQEKAQLVKEGKIKKQKPLPPISDEDKPFELPEGWEWCRIGNIVNIKSELVSPKDYLNLYQVAPDIIEKGTGRVISKRTVKESGVKGPNSRFYKGQIVYSKIRPSLSKVFLAEYNGLCSADMYPLDCYINPNYLLKYILSIPFLMQVKKAENRIKMPKLNSDSFYNIIVAIPPYNEQQAIFDKINSIEAVCNGLISYIGIYHKTQLHLADALTDAATN